MDSRLVKMVELTDFEMLFKQRGLTYFTNGDYNVNIIGIRNLLDGVILKNDFNDILLFTYKKDGKWLKHIYAFTTDPGIKSLQNPGTSKETAILVEGLYRSTYCLGTHNGSLPHRTLVQRLKPVAVWRDGNKDNILNMTNPTKIEIGYFGINIHRAKNDAITTEVNGWSAGCLVFANSKDHENFILICELSAKKYGNAFTYTLINSDMLTKCVQ